MTMRNAITVLFALCCFGSAARVSAQVPSPPAMNTVLEDIANNPEQFYGKAVTVRAKVDDVFARTLFEVEHAGFLGIDDELLIVAPRADRVRTTGEWVQITGVVRRFVKTEVERTVSGMDWSVPDEVVMQFDARPAIIAKSIVAGDAAATPVSTSGSHRSSAAERTVGASIEDIAERPDQWYGKAVTVRGKVDDLFHRGVFDLEEGGFAADDEVLVVAGPAAEARKKGDWVVVTGTVSRFVDVDAERLKRGDDARLPEEIVIQFEKRPTIIATSVKVTLAP